DRDTVISVNPDPGPDPALDPSASPNADRVLDPAAVSGVGLGVQPRPRFRWRAPPGHPPLGGTLEPDLGSALGPPRRNRGARHPPRALPRQPTHLSRV